MATQFEHIYLNQSRQSGQLRFIESGLGWKANEKQGGSSAASSEPFLLESSEIQTCYWSRGARGHLVKVQTRTKGVVQLDGFDRADYDEVKHALKKYFNESLETREHSVRGWNWGTTDFEKSELVFSVSGKPAFEVPYSSVSNSNMTGKNEVTVEFNLTAPGERQVQSGDEVVEMRFFLPTVSTEKQEKTGDDKVKIEKKVKTEDGDNDEGEEDEEDGGEEDESRVSTAQIFYDQLKEKADIGTVAGDAIAAFSAVLFLTPRGRYDIDMYPTSMRLRGKTYDYKIPYKSLRRMFLLPKPDDIHVALILQLDPPLRQGQTRYPFLITQFMKDEEMEVELNVEDEEFEKNYKDKLSKKYDDVAHKVVSQCLRGLSGCRITGPSDFYSFSNQNAVSCSLKAQEGYLYPLDKCFIFMPKPTLYIPYSEVSHVTFSRLGGGSSSRTFDMTITLKGTLGEHQFSNIEKDEQNGLESFFVGKKMRVKNEAVEEQKMLAAALRAEADDDSDVEMGGVDRGSAGEDSEEPDEDFVDESDSEDSDVGEEFDEDFESEGDGSEAGSGDEQPPKKKAKV